VICSVFFTAGFIVREMGAFDYTNLVKFIISTCLIYAAPYATPSPLFLTPFSTCPNTSLNTDPSSN
jgi:hypothetical protein